MLNHLAVQLFADHRRMNARVLRFTLKLLRDYDLTQYRVLRAQELRNHYKSPLAKQWLAELVRLGFLEPGPVRKDRYGFPVTTYRMARPYMLTGEALAEFQRKADRRPASDRA